MIDHNHIYVEFVDDQDSSNEVLEQELSIFLYLTPYFLYL